MFRRLTVAGLVAALTLGAAGCGKQARAQGLTKTEYVKRANTICGVAAKKVTTVAALVFTGAAPSDAQIRDYAEKTFIPVIGQELRDLRALKVPDGDAATVKAIYDAVQAGLDRAEADPKLLAASGAAGPFDTANAKASAYGLTVCGAS